jgi:hypothetical protein
MMQLLGPRKPSDTVANVVVEKVFGVKNCDAVLDIWSDRLKPLVDAAQNPALACIWETKESRKKGYRTLMQELPLGSSSRKDTARWYKSYPWVRLGWKTSYPILVSSFNLLRIHAVTVTGCWEICFTEAILGLVDTGGKVVDGIDIPNGCKFVHANLLLAHMFHAPTGCQSMHKLLMVSASKGRTIKTILEAEFQHLEGQIDKLVSFKTMEYLQANIRVLLTTSYHTPRDELM